VLHDLVVGALGKRRARGDETVFDPKAEVSGEVEDDEREDVGPDGQTSSERTHLSHARTCDRIETLHDLSRRNHQLYPRKKTRDSRMGPVRSLTELGVYLKNYYARGRQ
jgi:hypothetical protein